MNPHDINELKAEFDKFAREQCVSEDGSCDTQNPDPDRGDEIDDEPVPAFVDDLADKLLAPSKSGIYLSRIDIKRVAEAIDESLPIKERKKMIKALFRHTTSRDYLRRAFDEFNKHINGRILIYRELSAAFPSSQEVFDTNISKAEKIQKMFNQIVLDFEEIDPTAEPMPI